MGFISIHDTHKLPYFNATITAKTKQSGNTSPLKFKTCLDGTELGYTIYTNARGYLCDHDGNLYTDSVCVSEDAYITATMPDGASTSWIVRYESDITVNDGMLLGRTVTDSERQSLTGKTFVKVEGVWRILLHSANTPDNRTLPLGDLDEVPAFNEWKEVQEVVRFNSQHTSHDIGEYAKSLIIQWEEPVFDYPTPIDITLGYENANNRKRYAQQVMVYNDTPRPVTIKDKQSGNFITSIDAYESVDIGLFFVQDSEIGNWKYDGSDTEDWNIRLEKWNTTIPYGSNNGITVALSDRTPDMVKIVVQSNAKFATGGTRPGEIPIILYTSNGISKRRNLKIQFVNESMNDCATYPAVIKSAGIDIAILYNGDICEISLPQTSSNFTATNNVILVNTPDTPRSKECSLKIIGPGSYTVPIRCETFIVNAQQGGISNLVFQGSDSSITRFNVKNTDNKPIWLNLKNDSDGTVQLMAVCPANDECNFTVKNSRGILDPIGVTETYPTSVTEASGTANFNAVFGNMKGLMTTMVLNFAAINKTFGVDFGDHTGISSFMYIDAPALYGINQSIKFSVRVEGFMTSANNSDPELYIGSRDGGNYRIDLENEECGTTGSYYVHPVTYGISMTRNGTSAPTTVIQDFYK